MPRVSRSLRWFAYGLPVYGNCLLSLLSGCSNLIVVTVVTDSDYGAKGEHWLIDVFFMTFDNTLGINNRIGAPKIN